MKTHPAIRANVRAEMTRDGVRQQDLCALLGINQQAMSNRLCGVTPFKFWELEVIADALGCPIAALVPEEVAADVG